MRFGAILIIVGVVLFALSSPGLFRGQAMFNSLLIGNPKVMSAEFQRTPVSEKTLSLENIDTLGLEALDGDIDLETNSEFTQNELIIKRTGAIETTIERSGQQLRVTPKATIKNCSQCAVSYTVRLKTSLKLELRSLGGSIRVIGRTLQLKAVATDGDISLKNTGNGQFDLKNIGGNVTIENAAGVFDLQLTDGNLSAVQLENAKVDLRSIGGNTEFKNLVFDDSQQVFALTDASLSITNAKNARLKIDGTMKLELGDIGFTGITQIKNTDGQTSIRNATDAILNLEVIGQTLALDNVAFSAGSKNTINAIDSIVKLTNLVLPDGLRLTGQNTDGSFENSLVSFVTRLGAAFTFESILAGRNPVLLEVRGTGSDIGLK